MNIAHKIELINKSYSTDAIGQPLATETKTTVFGDIESVGAKEFADAGLLGLKPDIKVTIWANEYNLQDELEANGIRYSIYRTYLNKAGRYELYCEKKAGANGQS